ncbi:hypothetical protein HETIRDRAFT_118627 [Heterobasidion irregulare TC 32-1]|uniref:Uncharacterized protein n=1 Tax=Heterobasidion irregulare (strain TC 32-1) TaxID=747525 RepID=W4JVF4_HETIT|nr:uncharacterized protein HETIRDRAFT_118627 [Heterobasidion irregulare TC 32-1]ETW77060.1 hypothetical protein HETIRDRAFT_118627 [Heterobasidion irregulare TC 32-1]
MQHVKCSNESNLGTEGRWLYIMCIVHTSHPSAMNPYVMGEAQYRHRPVFQGDKWASSMCDTWPATLSTNLQAGAMASRDYEYNASTLPLKSLRHVCVEWVSPQVWCESLTLSL